MFYTPAFSGPINIFDNTFEDSDAGIRTSETPGASISGTGGFDLIQGNDGGDPQAVGRGDQLRPLIN